MGKDAVAHIFDESLRALCVEHTVAILEHCRQKSEGNEQQRNVIKMTAEELKPAERIDKRESPFRQILGRAVEDIVRGEAD